MKKERKEELLLSFPAVPDEFMQQMKGRGSQNYVIFLTRKKDGELFARCFHRYASGCIAERQRYVFAPDGVVRYGKNDEEPWKILTRFREPVFCQSGYGYSFDNSYCILNSKEIHNSCLKYAVISIGTSWLFLSWLRLYIQHPNVEYLMKSNYGHLITEYDAAFYGGTAQLVPHDCINWKSNDLLKMLGLNRDEFKALRGNEHSYAAYRMWRESFPKYKPDELLMLAKVFGMERGTAEMFATKTGLKVKRIARYLTENEIVRGDYRDYLKQCEDMRYDLHDTAITMPHDFAAMHTRLSSIIKYGNSAGVAEVFRQRMEERKELEFREGYLIIRQPESFEEIVAEGQALSHCVGGYAERHALGKLHIMFIRQAVEPEKPFYTMEVSTTGKVIQVRGLRNMDPTDDVKELVEHYKDYLIRLFAGKNKKKKSKRSDKAAERIAV